MPQPPEKNPKNNSSKSNKDSEKKQDSEKNNQNKDSEKNNQNKKDSNNKKDSEKQDKNKDSSKKDDIPPLNNQRRTIWDDFDDDIWDDKSSSSSSSDDEEEDSKKNNNKCCDEDHDDKNQDPQEPPLMMFFFKNDDDNKPPKRGRDEIPRNPFLNDDDDDNPLSNNPLSQLFNIINKSSNNNNNNPNKKLKKNPSANDFYKYFKESNSLKPIQGEIKTLQDLIKLGETYDPNDPNRYVIHLKALNKCVAPLKELSAMIGMKTLKEMIVDFIFFRLQNLEDIKNEMWHLVLQGSPGCGKTEVAQIIGRIYYGLGIVKKDKFMAVKRSDLIGKYLGHTAKMTQEIFDKAKGGVLFIDEAYSLGNPEGRDSFAKECIDTINQNLTENKDTAVFLAGYKEQLNESFFSYNPGLNRRFKMRLTIDKYTASELRHIYLKKLKENEWEVLNNDEDKNIPLTFFEKNYDMFLYNGGDMENLWHLTKISHARRVFGKSNDIVKKISIEDIQKAFEMYSLNDEFKNRKNDVHKYLQNTMYI